MAHCVNAYLYGPICAKVNTLKRGDVIHITRDGKEEVENFTVYSVVFFTIFTTTNEQISCLTLDSLEVTPHVFVGLETFDSELE